MKEIRGKTASSGIPCSLAGIVVLQDGCASNKEIVSNLLSLLIAT
jgi:hypothetical protein